MKILFIFLTLLLVSTSSQANLFGASTYEECVEDGKVGRTNMEVRNLRDKCRQKFPLLSNLYKNNKANITCLFENGDELQIAINDKNVVINGRQGRFVMRTAEKIVVKDFNAAKVNARSLNSVLEIDMLEGFLARYYNFADTNKRFYTLDNVVADCSEGSR